jgi:hypothetical protein
MDHPHVAHEDGAQVSMVGARGIESTEDPSRHSASCHDNPTQSHNSNRVNPTDPKATEGVNLRQPPGDSTSANHSNCFQTADPELVRLSDLWPKLSPGDRGAILALAQSLGSKDTR